VTTIAYNLVDSATLFRRNLRRLRRYPSMTVLLIGMPIVFLLLFDGVFGAQLSRGLGSALSGGHIGRAAYLNYLTPGILLVMVGASVQGTAISVAMDMTGGIIDRFRTMAIARSAVLTGHVLASLVQVALSFGVVVGVAVAVGFRRVLMPLNGSVRSASSCCSHSPSYGWRLPSVLRRRASRPPAIRRCS
jgi:ABC-2 type transport system permease protein